MNAVLSNGDRRCVLRAGMFLVGLMLLASCTKTPIEKADDKGTVALNFSTSITSEVAPLFRAVPATRSVFPPRNTAYPIGMWICSHEDTPATFSPAMRGYGNLLASLRVAAKDEYVHEEIWSYTFDDLEHAILSVQQGSAVDIYAYYPFVEMSDGQASFTPEAVPFVSGETDWMWAEPKTLNSSETTVDAAGKPVTVPLKFHHAMTCIQVGIRCKTSSNVRLTSMTLTDSEGRLYTKGTMNVLNGTLIPDETSKGNQVTITPGTVVGTTEVNFNIIMPPVANYQDKQFTLSFVFNDIPTEMNFSLPSTMKSLTDGSDVSITEYAAGTRYRYHLTLDNTMRFEPVGVDEEWVAQDIELEI